MKILAKVYCLHYGHNQQLFTDESNMSLPYVRAYYKCATCGKLSDGFVACRVWVCMVDSESN